MNYSVNLNSGQTVEVVIGEVAQINVEQALNYIESGRVEITNYVNEWAKPEITNYTKEYAKPIMTEIVNQTTKPLIDNYLNTKTKPQIDKYVADNVKPYADSAQDSAAKAKISKDNAKTSETNAKASELAAASSAGVASAAAVDAKLWAVGTKTEKPEGSSKYWAEQAKNAVKIPDATETVKGIVRLATSDEVKAGTNNSAAITPLKFKKTIAQNLTNPSTNNVPSTKAVSDESSRLESVINNKVSKSGDTMTGDLLIKKNDIVRLSLRNLSRDSAVNPENRGAFGSVYFFDKNNVLTGLIENLQFDDGRIHILMRALNRGKSAQILVGVRADGTFYTDCPASSIDNSIVTTVSHGTNYVRFGNGLIIQWIYFDNTGATTWTFPTPFSNTNYAIFSNAAVWYNTANKKTTLIQITDTNYGESSKFMSYYLLAIGY